MSLKIKSNPEHKGKKEWQKNGHRVIECERCGYRHLFPFPSHNELEAFYRERYHREKEYIHYDEIDKTFIDQKFDELKKNRDFELIFKKVSIILHEAAPKTMIDIGCGNDLLSRFFIDNGWRGLVLEPNKDAAAYLRRFNLHVEELMLGDFDHRKLGPFSFINLQFVLEHVLDPEETLDRVAEMMTPHSLLRVCVPNDFSPGQLAWLAKSGMEPPWISYPDHINYFDFTSLKGLIERAGLTEFCRDTNFPLELLLLTENDYYSDETVCKKISSLITDFEAAWLNSGQESKLESFYKSLADAEMGRCATIYAKLK